MIQPICQICGTALDLARATTCERCGTPHHDDCWEYWGRCSVYACTGLQREGPSRGDTSLRVVEDVLTIAGDAAPMGPSGDFLDPIVAKRVMHYTAAGATIRLNAGEVAVEIPAVRVPLMFEPAALPPGWLHPEFHGSLRMNLRRGQTAWLVRTGDGRIRLRLSRVLGRWLPSGGDRPFLTQPDTIVLVRTWEDSDLRRTPEERGRLLLTLMCRLALGWGDTAAMDLSPVLRVPRSGESRVAFLEQLVRMRAVGRQMASMLALGYLEPFSASPSLPEGDRGR